LKLYLALEKLKASQFRVLSGEKLKSRTRPWRNPWKISLWNEFTKPELLHSQYPS